MRAYKDPQTGEFVPAPPASEVPQEAPDAQASAVAAPSGQAVEITELPGGGSRADLQGRFLKPLIGTKSDDGRVTVGHDHTQPAGRNKDAADQSR
jgi:hypothetical protein